MFSQVVKKTGQSIFRHTRRYTTHASLTKQEVADSIRYCKEMVLQNNSELFFLSKYFPKEHKDAFFVIHALNMELAQIKARTTTEQTSGIRIEFWRNSLKSTLQGNYPDTPILKALSYIAKEYNLTYSQFRNILKWREIDCKWKQAPSLEAIDAYSEGTYSTILYILLHICGIRQNIHAEHVASHIGKAWGICNLLRGTAHHAQRQQTYLPADLCAKHMVSEEMIYRGETNNLITEVVFEVADHAKAHLDFARKHHRDEVPKEAYKIFMPTYICEAFLMELQKRNFDIFNKFIVPPYTLFPAWRRMIIGNLKKTY